MGLKPNLITQCNLISTCCVSSHLQGNTECEVPGWKTTDQEIFAEIQHSRQNAGELPWLTEKSCSQNCFRSSQSGIRMITTDMHVRDIPWFIKIRLLTTGMSYSNFRRAQLNTWGLRQYKSQSASVSSSSRISVPHVVIEKELDPYLHFCQKTLETPWSTALHCMQKQHQRP